MTIANLILSKARDIRLKLGLGGQHLETYENLPSRGFIQDFFFGGGREERERTFGALITAKKSYKHSLIFFIYREVVYVLYVHNPESRQYTKDFTDKLKKEMVVLETCRRSAKPISDGENGCRFKRPKVRNLDVHKHN